MTDVKIGAWWAACCVEDLDVIRTAEDVAEVEAWLDPDEPSGARVWASKADALAAPDIARQVAARDYSPGTAARLGLPYVTGSG